MSEIKTVILTDPAALSIVMPTPSELTVEVEA